MVAASVGIAFISLLQTTREQMHTLHLQEAVTWSRPGAMRVLNMLTQAYTPAKGPAAHDAALKTIGQMVQAQSLTLTYNDILLLMAAVFFLALPLCLFLAKPPAGGAAEAH